MNRFSYHRADTVDDAIRALSAQSSARLIAGGTKLVDPMKYDVEQPST